MSLRKYKTVDSQKLVDMLENAIRKDVKNGNETTLLKIAEIKNELMIRCFEVDREFEKIEKKHHLSPIEIEKLKDEELDEKIKQVRQTATQPEELLVLGLLHASVIWREFLRICHDPKYIELDDKDKIEHFAGKYPEFFNKYPVIAKYMVCRGVFSLEAFRQFLIKCKNDLMSSGRMTEKNKKEKMQHWCELRAYYVQQTWKYMHKDEKFTNKDRETVYNEAFKMLMEDYNSFEEDQEEANKGIAKNELLYKKDAIQYIIDHIDEFEGADYENAILLLENLQNKIKYSGVLKQLQNDQKRVREVISGPGRSMRGENFQKI